MEAAWGERRNPAKIIWKLAGAKGETSLQMIGVEKSTKGETFDFIHLVAAATFSLWPSLPPPPQLLPPPLPPRRCHPRSCHCRHRCPSRHRRSRRLHYTAVVTVAVVAAAAAVAAAASAARSPPPCGRSSCSQVLEMHESQNPALILHLLVDPQGESETSKTMMPDTGAKGETPRKLFSIWRTLGAKGEPP